MADRPVRNYDGNYITCYPGSNQTDDGKLNMEFNMIESQNNKKILQNMVKNKTILDRSKYKV